ncbi:MAG: prepilin-type N-terminal cleavage/methylation domain-containing protein [Lachnospiraceae bacterium]|nr:prepilin-type N-terminal cleavage/methylation domain-containing protein [Lachnospiraceae bacterium]
MRIMKNNQGMSLVEVIVGFTLLLIMMVAFYGIIKLSSNMTMYSVDKNNDRNKYEENYYQDYSSNFDEITITETGNVVLTPCNSKGESLTAKRSLKLGNASFVKIFEKESRVLLGAKLYKLKYNKPLIEDPEADEPGTE